MRSDVNYSHSKNIGESIGEFCGVPIRTYNNFDLELDVALDVQRTVLRNQAMGCSDTPNTAEILPGEVLCSDNIIRRVTTTEATGYDAFKEQPVKMLVGVNDIKFDLTTTCGLKCTTPPTVLGKHQTTMQKKLTMNIHGKEKKLTANSPRQRSYALGSTPCQSVASNLKWRLGL